MSVKAVLKGWRDGDSYREHVRTLCFVTALSRYKIIGKPVLGLYGELKDEVFVLKLTMKTDPSDAEVVFVGNHAGPRLLGHEDIPPCFNPLQSLKSDCGEHGFVGTVRNPRDGITPYNRELYTVINLFFIALGMNRARQGGPIALCLEELSKSGSGDLDSYWAKSMNSILQKYESSLPDINSRLRRLDKEARAFSFPLIRQRLEKDEKLLASDIRF